MVNNGRGVQLFILRELWFLPHLTTTVQHCKTYLQTKGCLRTICFLLFKHNLRQLLLGSCHFKSKALPQSWGEIGKPTPSLLFLFYFLFTLQCLSAGAGPFYSDMAKNWGFYLHDGNQIWIMFVLTPHLNRWRWCFMITSVLSRYEQHALCGLEIFMVTSF